MKKIRIEHIFVARTRILYWLARKKNRTTDSARLWMEILISDKINKATPSLAQNVDELNSSLFDSENCVESLIQRTCSKFNGNKFFIDAQQK